jgi:hypothetical protein
MADDVDGGKAKWLYVGGISDGKTSRLALSAGQTYIQGSLGVNRMPTDKSLEVKGAAHVAGPLAVDETITAGGTIIAGDLALSTSPKGSNAGTWTSLSSNAYHGDDSKWNFPEPTRPAVTLEADSRTGEARFDVYMTTKASPKDWQRRLAIDGETGTVDIAGKLKVGLGLEVTGDARLSGALLNSSGGPYVSLAEVVDDYGPLPITRAIKTSGRTLLLLASGSGRRQSKDGWVGMDIQIDGRTKRQARSWTNEGESHKAFVPALAVIGNLPGGDHNITLKALDGTLTDTNDFYCVAILEV